MELDLEVYNTDWTNRPKVENINTSRGLADETVRLFGNLTMSKDDEERKLFTHFRGVVEFNGKNASKQICKETGLESYFSFDYPGLGLFYDPSVWVLKESQKFAGSNAIGVGFDLTDKIVNEFDGELEKTSVYVSIVHMPRYKDFEKKIMTLNDFLDKKSNESGEYDIVVCGGDFNRKTTSFSSFLEEETFVSTFKHSEVTTKAGNSLDQIFFSDKFKLHESGEITPCHFSHHAVKTRLLF